MLDLATRLALGPVLWAQAARLRRDTVELPEPPGPRRGVARGSVARSVSTGAQSLRLLIAGDSSAAGVGVRHQRDALAQPLAERVAGLLGVDVKWQLVAESGLTSQGVLQRLHRTQALEADIAVVVVGVNDITKDEPLAFAIRQRQHITDWLQVHAAVRHVVFPALPDMEMFPALPRTLAWYAGQAGRRNNRAQARWAATIPGVAHLAMDHLTDSQLFSEDGFHPGPALYARVVERIAAHVAGIARELKTHAETP